MLAAGVQPHPASLIGKNHYYPFGLAMNGPWERVRSGGNDAAIYNKCQYNCKELNDDFGLGWNDYGARWYDASVGRWWSGDLMAGAYMPLSPYNYVLNNPFKLVDPDGMAVSNLVGADGLTNEEWIESSRPGGNTQKADEYKQRNREDEKNKARKDKADRNWKDKIENPLAKVARENFEDYSMDEAIERTNNYANTLLEEYHSKGWFKYYARHGNTFGKGIDTGRKYKNHLTIKVFSTFEDDFTDPSGGGTIISRGGSITKSLEGYNPEYNDLNRIFFTPDMDTYADNLTIQSGGFSYSTGMVTGTHSPIVFTFNQLGANTFTLTVTPDSGNGAATSVYNIKMRQIYFMPSLRCYNVEPK